MVDVFHTIFGVAGTSLSLLSLPLWFVRSTLTPFPFPFRSFSFARRSEPTRLSRSTGYRSSVLHACGVDREDGVEEGVGVFGEERRGGVS